MARRKKFEDVVIVRAENRPDLPEDRKKQLNHKPRKEKRKFDSKAIFGYEFMGRMKSGGVEKGTFLCNVDSWGNRVTISSGNR
jgi:hypothetical protein